MSGVDLAQWLGAQLDADAVTVGAVRPDPGLYPQEPIEFILAGQDIMVPSTEAAERHIREFASPDRVLREIESKRELLALHRRVRAEDVDWSSCPECGHQAWPCRTLRLLALPYADRDGYRPEWAPTE